MLPSFSFGPSALEGVSARCAQAVIYLVGRMIAITLGTNRVPSRRARLAMLAAIRRAGHVEAVKCLSNVSAMPRRWRWPYRSSRCQLFNQRHCSGGRANFALVNNIGKHLAQRGLHLW